MPPTPLHRWRLALLVLPLALVVTACVPDGVRVPQSELSALLEPKIGLIAYLGLDGNVYTIDQGGGRNTPLTSDAHDDESGYHFYGMPTWSPPDLSGWEEMPPSTASRSPPSSRSASLRRLSINPRSPTSTSA